jgi:hypothetical protein
MGLDFAHFGKKYIYERNLEISLLSVGDLGTSH